MSPNSVASLPADCAPFVSATIEAARKLLREKGELEPMAFVHAESELAVVPIGDFPSKNAWAGAIRATCARFDARFVVMVMECWFREVGRGEGEDMMREGSGLESDPHAQDGVSFQLETAQGVWGAVVPVFKDFSGRRSFGPITMQMAPRVAGRFVGFIRPPGRAS